MALNTNEEGVEGYIYPPHKIQPLHTFDSSRWDQMVKLGGTDQLKNVNVKNLGGTD